ncbi:hypothetical protein Hypma_016481 [Hypsizygus marmoreus]|uniref:RING-type domain-containing protein n=1 Tax=Hypsizygus marmoreus TaxID=39966 RepID=A0A369J7Q9_HYPMA|nr:hypothetical protein Hypma_016481 [Hypsizygus marmoreus]
MRFFTVFAAVAALLVGVTQALPMSGGASDSLSTREPSKHDLLERGLNVDDLTPRADGRDMYERGLDVAFESDNYISKRRVYENALERRSDEDECAICLEKIRAPKGLGSFCPQSQHEQCRQCIETLIKQEGAKCPICRRPLLAANFSFRVCKAATPPPSPKRSPSPGGSGKAKKV